MSDWTVLERLLQTDPRDVGCEEAMEILHVYIELSAGDGSTETRYPGVAAHRAACGPCSEDFDGLLAAVATDVRDVQINAVSDDAADEKSVAGVRVELYAGHRELLRPLFELAEDSTVQLDSYLGSGRVLVALAGDQVIGHLQLVDTDRPGEVEVKNMAVQQSRQGHGVGGRLVRAAIKLVTAESGTAVHVATAAADVDNLRFYQRQGFRLRFDRTRCLHPGDRLPDRHPHRRHSAARPGLAGLPTGVRRRSLSAGHASATRR